MRYTSNEPEMAVDMTSLPNFGALLRRDIQ